MEGPVTEVAETAAGFFYASFMLPPEIHKTMLSKLSNLLSIKKKEEEFGNQGRFIMPISRIVINN